MKNCDLGLENAAIGLQPRAAFSRPRSQCFTIRTSQLANNIYIFPMVPLYDFFPAIFVVEELFVRNCPNPLLLKTSWAIPNMYVFCVVLVFPYIIHNILLPIIQYRAFDHDSWWSPFGPSELATLPQAIKLHLIWNIIVTNYVSSRKIQSWSSGAMFNYDVTGFGSKCW